MKNSTQHDLKKFIPFTSNQNWVPRLFPLQQDGKDLEFSCDLSQLNTVFVIS